MKNNIKILSGCKREIELDIEADEVTKEFERIVTQFLSRAKIPGFRPGKAPRDIIKQRFYPEIKESLINSLVPKALSEELKTQNLDPVGMPVVNDLHFKEGQPLHLKAQFEVWPEFNLPGYKKIKVKNKKVSVTDQEINQSLEELRLRSAQYVPVEGRGVHEEDYVVAEMKGKDLKTKKFLPQERVVVLAGHAENEEMLNKKLIGSMPGEENNFTLDYDKNHHNKKLAGKKIEYNLKVISIKEKKIPALNDEFAKEVGDFESLKDLKEKIKKEIISSKEKATKQDMAEEIIKKISDKLSIGLPEELLEQEYIAIMRRLLSSRTQQDIKKEDLEQLKSEGKKKAEQSLKNHLVLMKIAEKENLKVSDQEMHEQFQEIAKANNLPLAQIVDSVNKEGKREELRSSLLFKKTVDFLVEHAIIE
ncbi:MAG TPA: trigger factor [Candidatus Aminicenantes bacterium]|nr:trigger factor [Candidatus Aminicenantes bacterium]